MALTTALSDLFGSFYELFASLLGTVYGLVHALIATTLGLFRNAVGLVGDVLKGSVNFVGGVSNFLISNFVILAFIAAGGFAYFRYREQQGRPLKAGGNMKAN